MRKLLSSTFMLSVMLVLLISYKHNVFAEEQIDTYRVNMKRDLLILMMSYPDYITGISKVEGDKIYIVLKSGRKVLYDDKVTKNTIEKENNPDLQDMLEQIYPLNDINDIMPKDFDPGRIRVYALLNEVYGNSNQQVQSNLTTINIGRHYQFNKNNKASENLQRTLKSLVLQAKQNPRIGGFLYPMSGTFNYRHISGTNRLSPHAYGIAIDLKSDKSDYWKWASKEEGKKRLNSYPREIVKSFEDNNFVWGGKWSHFDILHFEYRPELILKSKYFGSQSEETNNWYDGAPIAEENVKKYIETIDLELNK